MSVSMYTSQVKSDLANLRPECRAADANCWVVSDCGGNPGGSFGNGLVATLVASVQDVLPALRQARTTSN
jgi:hypothetical protein